MRERLSRLVNRSVAAWGSPYGVALTVAVCTVGHAVLTGAGYLHTIADHYIAGLSELAMIACAFILHASAVTGKAEQLKLDALLHDLTEARAQFAGIEDLTEPEIEAMRDQLGG